MPTRQEFLGVVLPPEGIYCVVGIVGKRIHSQTFHKTILEADIAIDLLEEKGINSFVALASFETDRNRTAANAAQLKSFFLDLDCDPNCTPEDIKHYPSQAEALIDLKRFVKDLKLPRPTLVNSGNGLHAYWVLTEAVAKAEWKPVAERLKTLCILNGLKIDPAVPGDTARVLRAVGSSNFKDRLNIVKAEVLSVAPAVAFEDFRALLGTSTGSLFTEPMVQRPMDEVTKSLLANKPSSFKLILEKSINGEGCNQLLEATINQVETSEPMWRAALSIAQHCADRAKAIHAISNKHPEYSRADTEEKASHTLGPYRCETFWKDNPKGCEGCKHRGVIASPIMLGRGLAEVATEEDNVVKDKVQPSKVYTIPPYPFPYFRGKNGGVYLRMKNKEGETEDVLVYENDFYLVNTVDDPILGMSAFYRLHLPQDGVREFIIPMQDMISRDTFGKHVAHHGIHAAGKQMEAVMQYAGRSIKSYQNARRAEKSRLQFGWADNKTSFIVGDRQITATDITYSPPSSVTLGLTQMFRQEGTLEAWKKVVSIYNAPGMELHLFSMFAGFGSPLVPFSDKNGSIISLYSPEAGTGKTTMLQVINSIFGHPEELMLIKEDTMNSRISRVGTLQNITPTIDEITNETPEVASAFLYHYLQARGKNRLQGSHNIERVNTTTWKAHCIMTANASMEDKLHVKKRSPDGEMSRLLEFEWYQGNALNKTDSGDHFNPLVRNYGWAGDKYIQYVIRNRALMESTIARIQLAVDTKAGLRNRERFWSSLVTTSLVGGLMARNAGVLGFTDDDFERVFNWIVSQLQAKLKNAKQAISDPSLMLGAFVSEHYNDMLVINSGASRRHGSPVEAPIREPRGKLYIRYEPDTRLLYVNKPKFRVFCTESHMSYASVIASTTKAKIYVGDKKMRLGKGLAVSQPESALIFSNMEGQLFDDEAPDAYDSHPRDSNTN